ncbi:ABC transporter permease [Eubacterium sp.]|uniref:ABC transporter permease n=1 Tax=Eubacterium sp. TaxID=142586 RepID=UPI003F0B7FC2
MAFFDNIMLALESLKMNKMRAVLTMLGIIIGIGSVIAISTVGSSLSSSINSSMSSLGAGNITVSLTQKSNNDESSDKVSIKQFARQSPEAQDLITDEMIDEYRATFPNDVKYIKISNSVGTGSVTSQLDSSTTVSLNVLGANDEYANAEELNLMYGRFVDNTRDGERNVCVVSDYFVKNAMNTSARNAIGEKINVTVNGSLYSFFIEGVYQYESETSSTGDNSSIDTTDIYLPMSASAKISGSNSGYQSISVITSETTDTTTFLNTTGDFFASFYTNNDVWTCEASSLETVLSTVTSMISTVSLAIGAIAAISLLVGGIGVMNIMLVSITERTKEIGTRKALGAPNNSIRLQFITESVVICLIGGIIGILFGIGLGSIISKVIGFSASPSVLAILGSVGFSMLVGVVFGYAPASKAAKLDPIEALRYE